MSVQVSLIQELYDVSDAIVRTRAIQAFDHAAKAYPIHRIVRCAVRRKVGACVRRPRAADGLRRAAHGRGQRCCSMGRACSSAARATRRASTSRARSACGRTRSRVSKKCAQRLLHVIGDQRLRDQMFVVDWNFCNSRGNLHQHLVRRNRGRCCCWTRRIRRWASRSAEFVERLSRTRARRC